MPVIARAREVLEVLEKGDRKPKQKGGGGLEDLPLFAASRPKSFAPASGPSAVEAALDSCQARRTHA